jgi:beta-glucosidase
VTFNVPADKLAYYNENMKWVVEPGDFDIMVGSSSADADLLKQTINVK